MLLSSCFLEFWQLQNLCIFVKMSKATAKLGMPWDAKTSSRERDHQPEHKWNNMKRKWFEAKTLHSSKKHKTSAKCLSWWELQFLHARSLLPMPPSFVVAVFIDVTRSWLWHNYFPRYANGLISWMLLPVFNLSSAIFPFLTISSGTAYLCCDHLGLPCQTSTDQGHLPCVEYCTLGRKGRAWKMMRAVEMLWERFCGKMRTSRNKIFCI